MKIINYSRNPEQLNKILARGEKIDPAISEKVKTIINDVRKDKDKALFAYTQQFDNFTHTAETVFAGKDYFEKCVQRTDPEFLTIIREAKENIENYHSFQKQSSWLKESADGVKLGQRVVPLEKVGVYVPGGEAFYPSTVLMNIIPAKIAGVKEIIVVTPPVHFLDKPELGATLALLGIEKVYLVGGAQAIAALAFGTQSIPRVDKIVGPGNIYVSLAKREVFGFVDIDMIAGPSEVVILAQEGVSPEWVALDLLSQAEHRTGFESAILITDSQELALKIQTAIDNYLKSSEHRGIIEQILDNYGAIIIVDNIMQGAELVNRIAPEHLELLVHDADSVLAEIKHAGAIFIGKYSSEPVGDYWAGPNHVLPTGGSARFFSPLGVYDFVKRNSLIYYTKQALFKNAEKINKLAQYENLYFHGRAVMKRYEDIKDNK
ncbi:MAG: histidinol dehydrogenase [Spirochaetales bacterium]|nr:histidinol dehydrogenase [Spirochaetales bacterium]